jgi:hypothetical protein
MIIMMIKYNDNDDDNNDDDYYNEDDDYYNEDVDDNLDNNSPFSQGAGQFPTPMGKEVRGVKRVGSKGIQGNE